MNIKLSPNEGINELGETFGRRITQGVKSLLESKHLYQSILLDYEDLLSAMLKRVEYPSMVAQQFEKMIDGNWFALNKSNRNPVLEDQLPILFQTPDVKFFCLSQTCDRIEAFNSILSADVLSQQPLTSQFVLSGQTVQIFVFSFLCQSCKFIPEVFLIRRQGLKLTNSRRSPMEHIDVPTVIHKSVRRFYSGAVIAHQSRQTLAGIFLLRTLIEQWVRQVSSNPDMRADEALEAYMTTLPDDFKRRFPSLPAIYEGLSADMHAAVGDVDLFERARADIEKHFDARRLFEL